MEIKNNLKINFTKILFLWIPLFLDIDRVSLCDLAAVNECTTILSKGTDLDVLTKGISAIPAEDQLRTMCSGVNEFTACFKPKAAACSNDVIFSMTFGTIEKTINYLCVEGYLDILRYTSCWNQTEVTNDTTNCHIEQNTMIRSLQNRASILGSTEVRSIWCEILRNTTECMSGAVETRCGDEPACVMKTMMDRALAGLSGLMQCPKPVPCLINGLTVNNTDTVNKTDTNTTEVTPTSTPDTILVGATGSTENVSSRNQNPDCLTYIVVLLFAFSLKTLLSS